MVNFPIRQVSPALASRIDRLDGCQGRWLLDCRDIEGCRSYALRSLTDYWPLPRQTRVWQSLPDVSSSRSPQGAAVYCASTLWTAKLLFVPDWLNDDAWPGYKASSVRRSNYRVFSRKHKKALVRADGDGYGLSLDVRFISDEMIEDIVSLENYPLLSEDEHCRILLEDQDAAWDGWVALEFCRKLENRLDGFVDDVDSWIETINGSGRLRCLFETLREAAGCEWDEYDGASIDVDKIIDRCDDLTLILRVSDAIMASVRERLAGENHAVASL